MTKFDEWLANNSKRVPGVMSHTTRELLKKIFYDAYGKGVQDGKEQGRQESNKVNTSDIMPRERIDSEAKARRNHKVA